MNRVVYLMMYDNEGTSKTGRGCIKACIGEVTERVSGSYYTHIVAAFPHRHNQMECYEVLMGERVKHGYKSGKFYEMKMQIDMDEKQYQILKKYFDEQLGKQFNMDAYCCNFCVPYLMTCFVAIWALVFFILSIFLFVVFKVFIVYPILTAVFSFIMFFILIILMISGPRICTCSGKGKFCAQFIVEGFEKANLINLNKKVRTNGYVSSIVECCCFKNVGESRPYKTVNIPPPHAMTVKMAWDVINDQTGGLITSSETNINAYSENV